MWFSVEVFVSAIWLAAAAAAGKSSASLFPQDVVVRWRRHRRRRPRFLPQSLLWQDVCECVCVWVGKWRSGGAEMKMHHQVWPWENRSDVRRQVTLFLFQLLRGPGANTRPPPKLFSLGYIKKFSNVQLWIYVFVIIFLCCTNHNQTHVFIFCQDSCSNRQKVPCSRPRWWIKPSLSAARLMEPKWCGAVSFLAC